MADGKVTDDTRIVRQAPRDEDPVGLVAVVDAVAHGPVEVAVVRGERRPQLGEVEVSVPPDQGIERPGDHVDAPVQGPRPLVLLEGEPHVASLRPGVHAQDVRMQLGCAVQPAQEPHDGPHHPGAVVGAEHVVPRVRQRPQRVPGDQRIVPRGRPDRVEQVDGFLDPGHVVQLDDGQAGPGRGGLGRRRRLVAEGHLADPGRARG